MQSSLKVVSTSPTINFSNLIEPEDARITGVTRSLHRRLLALNLPALPAARKVSTSVPLPARVRIA